MEAAELSHAPRRRPPMLLSPPKSPGGGASREKRIRVCVRVRPFARHEAAKAGAKAAWTWHENTIYQQIFPAQSPTPGGGPCARKPRPESLSKLAGDSVALVPAPPTPSLPSASSTGGGGVSSPSNAHLPSSYSFDHLYGPSASTAALYEASVKESIVAAVEGYHSSVFVYGQTGTGKTYTMLGKGPEPGLVQLAVEDIFAHIAATPESEFLLRFSYLEIYNERVYDLLAGGTRSEIKIYEIERPMDEGDAYACNDVVVKGLQEEIVVSVDHVLSLVESGNYHRHTAATDANDESSRSHTVFRLVIESQTKDDSGTTTSVRAATLNLVDLAGSESVRLANTSGASLEEGRHINRSLLTLGHIIWKLSRGRSSKSSSSSGSSPRAEKPHLPYRNSKLTRILQPALGGKAQISIICTISPSVECLAETHNTLKFATRARRVKSRVAVSETSGESALLRKYRARIKELEQQLEELELRKASVAMRDTQAVINISTIEERQVELRFAIENIKRVILNSSRPNGSQGDEDGDGLLDADHTEPPTSIGSSNGGTSEADTESQSSENHVSALAGGDHMDTNGLHVEAIPIGEEVAETSVSSMASPAFSFKTMTDDTEPEAEGSVGSRDSRRNLSILSDGSRSSTRSRRRETLTTVLKNKYASELAMLSDEASEDAVELPGSVKYRELLREFVRGLEIADAENETRWSHIRELELENRHLRALLQQRDDELLALRTSQRSTASLQSSD